MATDFVWDDGGAGDIGWDGDTGTTPNAWGRSVAPMYPGGIGSSLDDTVTIASFTPPTAGPSESLTIAEFQCSGSFADTANLTVTDSLVMGAAGQSDSPVFAGWATDATTIVFQGASNNGGTVGDGAVFMDTAVNGYVVGYRATFDDGAGNLNTGAVDDDATFNDSSYNNGIVGYYAIFNDSSTNNSFVDDEATFNGYASNYVDGSVARYAVFNDSSTNSGTVGDDATFNGSSCNYYGGSVGDYTTFNSDATQYGTYMGTSYTLAAATTFDASCSFVSGTSFGIANPSASFVQTGSNPITSDGGTTPIPYLVTLGGQPDLDDANILVGKTILGVAGAFNESARNTDPGVTNVKSGTSYKIANSTKNGTLDITADNPPPAILRMRSD